MMDQDFSGPLVRNLRVPCSATLIPSALAGAVIGDTLMAIGVTLSLTGPPRWFVLSTICILIAALCWVPG